MISELVSELIPELISDPDGCPLTLLSFWEWLPESFQVLSPADNNPAVLLQRPPGLSELLNVSVEQCLSLQQPSVLLQFRSFFRLDQTLLSLISLDYGSCCLCFCSCVKQLCFTLWHYLLRYHLWGVLPLFCIDSFYVVFPHSFLWVLQVILLLLHLWFFGVWVVIPFCQILYWQLRWMNSVHLPWTQELGDFAVGTRCAYLVNKGVSSSLSVICQGDAFASPGLSVVSSLSVFLWRGSSTLSTTSNSTTLSVVSQYWMYLGFFQ